MNRSQNASTYFRSLSEQIAKLDHDQVDAYVELIHQAWTDRRRVYVFGNGGSAFTASHHVNDYVKTASVDGEPRLRAFSLADNTGLMTSLGNDISYDDIFVYQLESYAEPGDIAVAISCSGNSPNVVKAMHWAKDHGLATVAMTGFSGGKIAPMADLNIHIPCENYGVIEDIHMAIAHVVAQSLHTRLSKARLEKQGAMA